MIILYSTEFENTNVIKSTQKSDKCSGTKSFEEDRNHRIKCDKELLGKTENICDKDVRGRQEWEKSPPEGKRKYCYRSRADSSNSCSSKTEYSEKNSRK